MAEHTGLYYYTKKEIDEQNTYSTDEMPVGTWIDGKTIYRKTVNFGTLPNATTEDVPHGISDLDNVIKLEGIASNGSGTVVPLPHAHPTAASAIMLSLVSDNIRIRTGSDRSNHSAYVTIYYTKTATS